jgi:hypothetical protein
MMFFGYQHKTFFVVLSGALVTVSIVAVAGFYFLENRSFQKTLKEQIGENSDGTSFGSPLSGNGVFNSEMSSTGASQETGGNGENGSGSGSGFQSPDYLVPENTDWSETTEDEITDDDSSDTGDVDSHRLTVKGDKLYDSSGDEVVLRGFNWGWFGTALEQDAVDNKSRGATAVRIPMRWYFEGTKSDVRETGGTCNMSASGLQTIDSNVAWAAKNHLWVVLFMGSDLGAGNSDNNYWTNPTLKAEFKATWLCIAQRYKNVPYIGAYEILSEPHPKKSYTDGDPEKAVREFYEEMIRALRTVDTETPLMIGPNDHYEVLELPSLYTNVDDNLIYTFNFYYPSEYVKQTKDGGGGKEYYYPGSLKLKDGSTVTNDKSYLENMLKHGVDFRSDHDVPIFINQVGIRSGVPDSKTYIADVLDLFKSYDIGWTYWTYRVRGDADDIGIYYQNQITNAWGVKSDWLDLVSSYFK